MELTHRPQGRSGIESRKGCIMRSPEWDTMLGLLLSPRKLKLRWKCKYQRKTQFGRKTLYHESVSWSSLTHIIILTSADSVETDMMRVEALNFSWPEAFPTLQNAYAYVLRICEIHNFKFSYIPSANGKSFRKLVRKTVAHRALEAGEFFIDKKWPSTKRPTLPQNTNIIVRLPPTPLAKAIPPRPINQARSATVILEPASTIPRTEFSFRCDLSVNAAPKTGRELPTSVNIITKIRDLVSSFENGEEKEDLPRTSLDVSKIVNEISMILEQAPHFSSTSLAPKTKEMGKNAPESERYCSESVDVSSTIIEQTPRLPSPTLPLETDKVEERARGAKLHCFNPYNMSPINMVLAPHSPSPTPSLEGEKGENTIATAELGIADPADWVCSMLGERIAAAEERSRQFRADETCRDLGKLIAEAEQRFSSHSLD
jgi:hypothetical protein